MAGKRLSKKGAMEIVAHEAIVLTPYRDSVGVWTIGVGHTAAAGPPDPKTVKSLTTRQCFELFRNDIRAVVKEVKAAIRVDVTQAEFDALVSFHFNTGGIGQAALTDSINGGDKTRAAEEFMNWSKPPEIIPRRKKEQKLFATGVYSGGGKATVYPADANGKVNFSKGKQIDLESEV